MPAYISQLADPQSEASLHLAGVRTEVLELEKCDSTFVRDNFRVDSHYFDLQKLAPEPSAQAVPEKAEPLVRSRRPRRLKDSRTTAHLGYQSWTINNLCIASDHNGIRYYTPRWDALCPYIDITQEMLVAARKPFIVYALPPEGPYGVPINDKYGLVDTSTKGFWEDPRRARKFRELDNQYKRFNHSEAVVAGRSLTVADIRKMGGDHFSQCYIEAGEIAGFVDYIRHLKILILQVHDQNGTLLLTDVSMLLPERGQLYGSFCQWNRAYKNRSPGIYACVLACRWAAKNGYRYYNLGPVEDYDYKALFVTDYETIYGLALTELDHPLALDPTSPLHVDFGPDKWNQVYRTATQRRPGTACRQSARS
jgi:hypothetical protein